MKKQGNSTSATHLGTQPNQFLIVGLGASARQRKAAEAAIRQAAEQRRLALEAAEMGAWDYRFDTGEVFWDQRCRDTFGVTAGTQIDYEAAIACIHPEDRAATDEAIKQALAGADGGAYHREFRVVWPDGSTHWVASHGRVHFEGEGANRRAVRFIGVNQEVTARHWAEEKLRQLNRTLKALSNSSQAMLRATNESELLQAVCRIIVEDCGHAMVWVGFAEDDAGKTVRPVAHAGFEEGYLQTLNVTWADTERGRGPTGTAIRTGQPSLCRDMASEARFAPWRAEALKRGYAASVVVPLLTQGKPFGAITIYSRQVDPFSEDEVKLLTELASELAYGLSALRWREGLHRAREQLARANAGLERQVQERTAELRETIAHLEAFSYTVVHDLRAPLRAMQGFGQMLEQECAPQVNAEGRDFIRRIVTAAHRMDQLIKDVLSFSSIARQEPELAVVDVHELVSGMLESYPCFQPPHADIALLKPLPRVRGNEALLTQIVSNLLDNAVKFVAPGVTPQVRIWAEPVPSGDQEHTPSLNSQPPTLNSFIRLWFEDNGIGIPADMRERIFEVFQRLSTRYEGTGIGLAIVRKAAERMGGRTGVESELGKGSRFWVELRAGD
jgi:PAS domain S-box-containing protein